MIKIIPAILPQAYRAIESGVAAVGDVVDTIQIDFVDGYFAPNKTWLFNGKDTEVFDTILSEENALPQWDAMNYELDLMVRDPLSKINTFMALGPSKIIFHLETLDQGKTIQYFETLPEIIKDTVKFGIAINIDTDPVLIEPYIPFISSIQCMGIAHIGFQGQTFDVRAVEQVKKVKELYPDIIVSVDGGVTNESIVLLVQAGATELVVGSFIFRNSDPRGTIERLENICNTTIAPEK